MGKLPMVVVTVQGAPLKSHCSHVVSVVMLCHKLKIISIGAFGKKKLFETYKNIAALNRVENFAGQNAPNTLLIPRFPPGHYCSHLQRKHIV
jgi:hypothetical protein